MTGATCGAGSAYPSGAPEITLSFLVGFVLLSPKFSMLCLLYYYLSVVFSFFSHIVVSLFSTYEFDCLFGIFNPSFIWVRGSELHRKKLKTKESVYRSSTSENIIEGIHSQKVT